MSLELEDQYDKIYKYCYFKVKNPHIAEDLTQETFLKYFSQNSYINRGKPLAYLYTIAKNLCIDTYKKTENLSLDDDIESIDTIEDFETNIALKQAISTMSKDLQEIVLLRFANDLSMAEISYIMGLSRFAIYRKVKSALKQLKFILREEDFS
ncbi:RNA polymerase sigma factor [Clostridium sediminicola]|uniref:RNA polymerase sigma factor n=1 Tax=Clostridium sediminicola TaxID=3114879 RepID=UPI0031F260EB